MKYPHLATRLYNCALLITPGKAEIIEQAFRAHAEGRAAVLSPQAEPKQPRQELAVAGAQQSDAGYWRTPNGIAVIPVVGTLVQRGDSMDAMSGLVGYNTLAAQYQAALADPRIDAVLFEIDSNGGEANGAFDLAAKIQAGAKVKPTWAIANEQAFSAAYLLASAAGQVHAPESAMVGSVGVVMLHVDQSGSDAKRGLVYTPIFAGDKKVDFSSHAPLTDAARATAQEEVNRVYDLFVNAVATGRGIDPQAVRDTQAGLLNPRSALDAGFIDGIQSFDETLAALAAEAQHVRTHGMRAPSKTRASAPALPATLSNDEGGSEMDPKELQAKLDAAKAEGEASGKAAAQAEAAKALADAQATSMKASQERIASILGHAEAKGRETMAQHLALKTAQSLEDAVALLAASPKEAAASPPVLDSEFAKRMAKEGNGRVVPDAAASGRNAAGDPNKPAIWTSAQIFAFRKECVAKARKHA